ncbi:unnamed protein product [Microthlaspi erraticum]|uniref:Uncharacterized protein n=1 Tax=Microthlaspi erraticum TaxID=1685480 RepID=A0A6D2IFX6_9BRAS|nr:unnamed protein product [Microthlaspi erraticum]
MPLEVCNLDKPFRRYHVCTEDWLTAGRTHSAGQEGNWLRSAFSRTIRPHDHTVRPGRQWTTIDRDHHITADQTVRPGKQRTALDPISANKKPTYAVLTILSPINLNRLVKT